MKLEWIDGSITPSLINTNRRCLLIRSDDKFSLGIYSFPDGWFDIIDGEEINNGLIKCYARLDMPKKRIQETKTIIWE